MDGVLLPRPSARLRLVAAARHLGSSPARRGAMGVLRGADARAMVLFGGRQLRYAIALAPVALALALRLALVSQGYLFLFFYPAVAAAAWWGGVGPGIAAALVAALVVNLVLIPPASTLNLDPE